MTTRVRVDFSDEVYDELLRLADERASTLADVLRDAVTLYRYVHDAESNGSRILVELDGERREVRLGGEPG